MEHPELQNTVFGEVFIELLEARSLPVTPFEIGLLVENAGLDGWKVLDRMAAVGTGYAWPLDGLASALDLTRPKKIVPARSVNLTESFASRLDSVLG